MPETEQSLPVKRFPLMFDDGASPQWFPLPADLPVFLRGSAPNNPVRWLIIELFQHLPFEGGTEVQVTDATLAARTGLTRSAIQDARNSLHFQRLVSVAPGEPRSTKNPNGIPTVYDLHK